MAMVTLTILFLASGCATVVGKVSDPILNLAGEDAAATLVWIDEQVLAGNITPEQEVLAKLCPQSVLELNALRVGMEASGEPDGFRGLIYFGTLKKYGGGGRDVVIRSVTAVAANCLPLVPYERLRILF